MRNVYLDAVYHACMLCILYFCNYVVFGSWPFTLIRGSGFAPHPNRVSIMRVWQDFGGVVVWRLGLMPLTGSCTMTSKFIVKDQLRCFLKCLMCMNFLFFCLGIDVNDTTMRNEYSYIILCFWGVWFEVTYCLELFCKM